MRILGKENKRPKDENHGTEGNKSLHLFDKLLCVFSLLKKLKAKIKKNQNNEITSTPNQTKPN